MHRIVQCTYTINRSQKKGTWYCPQYGLETFEGCQGGRSLKQKNPISSHRRPIENNLSQIYPAFVKSPIHCQRTAKKTLYHLDFQKERRDLCTAFVSPPYIVNLLTHRQRHQHSASEKIFGSCRRPKV